MGNAEKRRLWQNRGNHLLHILALNQVGFQLKLIILLQFILNQPQTNGILWVTNKKAISGRIDGNKY